MYICIYTSVTKVYNVRDDYHYFYEGNAKTVIQQLFERCTMQ